MADARRVCHITVATERDRGLKGRAAVIFGPDGGNRTRGLLTFTDRSKIDVSGQSVHPAGAVALHHQAAVLQGAGGGFRRLGLAPGRFLVGI
jgi:hypothetical protein